VVCSDQRVTAGPPHHIVLSAEPPLVKPNGDTFLITANGSDAGFVLATVVDSLGNWCPTDSHVITFSVSGPGNYRGGSDQYVTVGKPLGYHAPLDPELRSEGGMCKVAVRSTFTAGTVTVNATSTGLGQGTASFTVYPLGTTAIAGGSIKSAAVSAVMPAFKTAVSGSVLKYFIKSPAIVAITVLDASGRVLKSIPAVLQAEGWHPVQISGTGTDASNNRNGVYFVKFMVNGASGIVKRVMVTR
jgi:beta-galactosidase